MSDIVIRGAREHNLRNVDLTLPRNKLIVMSGVSGSGKSSLAFDTLYAEGQRRYVESLSTYARQFLGQLPKPEVDAISGPRPSISDPAEDRLAQPARAPSDDHRDLRLPAGPVRPRRPGALRPVPEADHCPDDRSDSWSGSSRSPRGTAVPDPRAARSRTRRGSSGDLFADLLKQGFLRARGRRRGRLASDDLQLKKHFKHTIEVVVDRLVAGKQNWTRLAEAIETAVRLSGGTLLVDVAEEKPRGAEARSPRLGDPDEEGSRSTRDELRLYSAKYALPRIAASATSRRRRSSFSFNSLLGMCPSARVGAAPRVLLIKIVVAGEVDHQGAAPSPGDLQRRWAAGGGTIL